MLSGRVSNAAEEQGLLDLLDGLGDLNTAGAGLGAVERGPAPEHAAAVLQDLQALPGPGRRLSQPLRAQGRNTSRDSPNTSRYNQGRRSTSYARR